MFSGKGLIDRFKTIVGNENVLTDAEDLYVYSLEHFFRKRRYSNLAVVVRVSTEEELRRVEELAHDKGMAVVRRSAWKQEIKEEGKAATVLLDETVPPELQIIHKNEGRERSSLFRKELEEAGHGTFRNFALALKSLFSGLPAQKCLDCQVCSGYCTVASYFNGVETWSSKGRVLLTRALSSGELQLSPRLVDVLYTCNLCGLCFAQCFQETEVRKAIMNARHNLADKGLTPTAFTESAKNISNVGDPSGVPLSQRISWMRGLPQPHFTKTADILYWVGCVVATRTPNVARAVVNVLNNAKVNFTMTGEREGCCGYVLLASGLWKDAEENAVGLADRVKQTEAEILVTSCAGCYYTFKKMYPEMLDIELPCEILHLTQFVERQLRDGQLQLRNLSMKVTYHDPCSLGRHSNVYDSPRNILKDLPSLKLVEMQLSRNRARCCGAGGGLWSFNNRVASESAYNRLANDVAPLDVDVVATACPTCHINLHFASARKSLGVRVCDVMELVDMATSEQASKA